MKMKTVNGHKLPDKAEIHKKIAEIEKTVKNTAGLTNVKTSVDLENYIATLSCNFSRVDDLNNGIKNIGKAEKNSNAIENTYDFNQGSQTFSRLNKFLLSEEYKKMRASEKEIFATANYTSIFRFEHEIISSANRSAWISANKKAVMLKLNALDILTNKRSVENKINLTK